LFVRSASARAAPLPRPADEQRRAWIEALFGGHLPREPRRREAAIAALAADAEVWRLLHQARHSMAETTALIERLAARAQAQAPLRAA
ncbi:MAG: hypothetical protein ABW194_09305, partial [Novosphingobium sp.]